MKKPKFKLLVIILLLISVFLTACSIQQEVDLCDYKNIKIPSETLVVSDEDIDTSIRMQLLEKKATISKEVNQNIIENDDVVTIHISGEQIKDEEITIIVGSDEFAEGFDSQILGKKLGESYTISLKEHKYEVTVCTIRKLAEIITDELANKYFNVQTAKDVIENTKKEIIQHRAIDYAYLYLLNNSSVRVNNKNRDEYVQKILSKLSNDAEQSDQSVDEYIQNEFEMTIDEYKESIISFYDELLILEAFLAQEGESVSEKDIQNYTEKLSQELEMTTEEIITLYGEEVVRYEMCYESTQKLLEKYIVY